MSIDHSKSGMPHGRDGRLGLAVAGLLLLASALALGCSGQGSTAGPSPQAPPARPSEPEVESACTSDADCHPCPADECGCYAASGACAPTVHSCVVDPCHAHHAVCRNEECVLERNEESIPRG